MRDIIITGSSGLIGTEVTSFFKKTDTVKECDLSLGHDLNDESFVKDLQEDLRYACIKNCFKNNTRKIISANIERIEDDNI